MTQQAIHLDPELIAPVWLRRVCEQHADRPALVFKDDVWSYRRLYNEVLRMEAVFVGLGATKGTRIGILMGARPEWVVTFFAAMGIGAVAVPISTYEPAKQRHQLFRHADASILVLQDRMLNHVYLDELVHDHPKLTSANFLDERLPYLRHVIHLGDGGSKGSILSWDDALKSAPTLPAGYLRSLETDIHPTDDALIIYTSGTSGLPKGVLHAHRAVAIQFDRIPGQFTITSDDVVWGSYPLFWSAGIAWLLGPSLTVGAKVVLQEFFDPVEALDLIERHGVTVAHSTPVQLTEMEESLASHPADVSSVRILPRGSLPEHVHRPSNAPFGGASLGLTETLTLAASIPWDSPLELRLGTSGRALPGTSIKIIDPITGETLQVNEHGEIALKGTTLMKGYNKTFPETYLDDCGYYRTRDAGYLDADGYLHFTGRMSQVIRTNSANVAPQEVEKALYEIPGVKLAVVFGMPDPTSGEVVVACLTLKLNTTLTESEVRAQLKDKLATYKIPRHVIFLEDSELELTATGKARLTSLQEIVAARLGSDRSK